MPDDVATSSPPPPLPASLPDIPDPEPRPDNNHPLRFPWTLWYMPRAPGQKITDYEAATKSIASFDTAEQFWACYGHLCRPDVLANVSDVHLFKQGLRPVWEDPENLQGGKWMIRLKKGLASRYWESLLVAILGEQFDAGEDVCGAVLSIRSSEDILALWNRDASDTTGNLRMRDTMKKVLALPADTMLEYKAHNESLKDNSSFRNTNLYK